MCFLLSGCLILFITEKCLFSPQHSMPFVFDLFLICSVSQPVEVPWSRDHVRFTPPISRSQERVWCMVKVKYLCLDRIWQPVIIQPMVIRSLVQGMGIPGSIRHGFYPWGTLEGWYSCTLGGKVTESFSGVVATNEGGVSFCEGLEVFKEWGCFPDDKAFWADGMRKGTEMGNRTWSSGQLQIVH